MFGIGGRAFTHAIERELSVDFPQAESLKLGLSDGNVAHQHKADVEKALNKTLNVWANGVELALAEFTRLDHLPHRVLLCGGGSSLDMLLQRLEADEWYKELPFTRKPAVQHIKPEDVAGITDATGDVSDHTLITAMGLLRVGVDTISSDGDANGQGAIKDKINKVLRV
jgi:cell division protein FtsA